MSFLVCLPDAAGAARSRARGIKVDDEPAPEPCEAAHADNIARQRAAARLAGHSDVPRGAGRRSTAEAATL